MKIKRGDKVLIIKGKDRGKTGKVLHVLREKQRVVVENLNLMRKAVRPSGKRQKGGMIEFPAALSVANVQIICTHCGKKTRVGYKVSKAAEKGKQKKERICKKCRGVI